MTIPTMTIPTMTIAWGRRRRVSHYTYYDSIYYDYSLGAEKVSLERSIELYLL